MTDQNTLAEIDAEIDRLTAAAERLRELGDEAEMPAIERNAERIEGVARTLEDNLPAELLEE